MVPFFSYIVISDTNSTTEPHTVAIRCDEDTLPPLKLTIRSCFQALMHIVPPCHHRDNPPSAEIEPSSSFLVVVGFLWLPPQQQPIDHPLQLPKSSACACFGSCRISLTATTTTTHQPSLTTTGIEPSCSFSAAVGSFNAMKRGNPSPSH